MHRFSDSLLFWLPCPLGVYIYIYRDILSTMFTLYQESHDGYFRNIHVLSPLRQQPKYDRRQGWTLKDLKCPNSDL